MIPPQKGCEQNIADLFFRTKSFDRPDILPDTNFQNKYPVIFLPGIPFTGILNEFGKNCHGIPVWDILIFIRKLIKHDIEAVANEEWIVITGWKPHFMWANFDIKYLADPKDVYPADVCAIVARKNFREDMPQPVVEFFENFNLEEEQLYNLMGLIKLHGEEEGAMQWYEGHRELINAWFEGRDVVF